MVKILVVLIFIQFRQNQNKAEYRLELRREAKRKRRERGKSCWVDNHSDSYAFVVNVFTICKLCSYIQQSVSISIKPKLKVSNSSGESTGFLSYKVAQRQVLIKIDSRCRLSFLFFSFFFPWVSSWAFRCTLVASIVHPRESQAILARSVRLNAHEESKGERKTKHYKIKIK